MAKFNRVLRENAVELMYRQAYFVTYHLNFLDLQRSVNSCAMLSSTILTALILLIVSRDLVLLPCLFRRFLTHYMTEDK